jgi:Ran GTPase-activating protein (RanGAP) involved in mRNA processing and transport
LLDLRCNHLGDAGISVLASGLPLCVNLASLDVSKCQFSDDGAKSLSRALKHGSRLVWYPCLLTIFMKF